MNFILSSIWSVGSMKTTNNGWLYVYVVNPTRGGGRAGRGHGSKRIGLCTVKRGDITVFHGVYC